MADLCFKNTKELAENEQLKASVPDTNALKQFAGFQESLGIALSAAGNCTAGREAIKNAKATLKEAQTFQEALDYVQTSKPTSHNH